jgi:hypothetical protein
MTGLGNPPTCSVQFVNEDFLGETICCVITGMLTEEEAEEEEEEKMEREEDEKAEEEEEKVEEEEEVRESLSIGNPFSFVIRSGQTLQDRPAVVRRISLKRCYKAVGPRWRHLRRESSVCTRDGNPSTMR